MPQQALPQRAPLQPRSRIRQGRASQAIHARIVAQIRAIAQTMGSVMSTEMVALRPAIIALSKPDEMEKLDFSWMCGQTEHIKNTCLPHSHIPLMPQDLLNDNLRISKETIANTHSTTEAFQDRGTFGESWTKGRASRFSLETIKHLSETLGITSCGPRL